MNTQLIIRIEQRKKDRLLKTARREGKTASEKVRELVDDYVAKNDFATIVDDLWNRISKKAQEKGITEKEIDRVIKEVRESKKRKEE